MIEILANLIHDSFQFEIFGLFMQDGKSRLDIDSAIQEACELIYESPDFFF